MNRTKIEYLDFTWSPIAMRCTPVSEGCTNCWHIKRADMLNSNPKISHNIRLAYGGNAPPILVPERLDEPLKRKKPAIIGVQFMGDLFHEDVPFYTIDDIFDVIRQSNQHTFLILTKRPKRMYEWADSTNARSDDLLGNCPNLYLGVTAENQQTADERIPILLQIPAAKRFVSIEPMLGWVDLAGDDGGQPYFPFDNEEGTVTPGLDWVIAGCESGPGRRPAKIEWFRDLKNQCFEARVPFFLKQMATEPPTMAGCETGLPMYYENFKSKVIKMPELDGKIWNERP